MAMPAEDLFELASSLAQLVGAPITIEDENSAMLAYSGGGAQTVDEARVATILGRRVPGHYRQMLVDAGVFDRLRRESGVIYVDLGAENMRPRAVIAVRDGDVLVGSIWAAMPAPPTTEQEQALRAAVTIVARRIVAERARANRARRSQQQRLQTLIVGGEPAQRTADELALPTPLTVAAIAEADGQTHGMLGPLDVHLQALGVDSVIGQLDEVLYVVLGSDERSAARVLSGFVDRQHGDRAVVVAVGRQIDDAGHLHLSRADADRALAVLLAGKRWGAVATIHDCLAGVLALRSAAVLDGLGDTTPLGRLSRFDRDHGSALVTSVAAFLDHGGDIGRAAAQLHVHPNTLRNRLRRAADACGADVSDPDVRLVLMTELRLAALRR